jgi:uncharacterized protein
MKQFLSNFQFLFIGIFSFFGILYFLYVSYIYFNQGEMVFNASKLPKNHPFSFAAPFREMTFKTSNDVYLHGVLFGVEKPKGLVFYLHGNRGTVDSWGQAAGIFTKCGYDFFVLDYRGFGKSTGLIEDEEMVHQDIETVFDVLSKQYKQENIVIIGYSIGTGIAAKLSSERNSKMLILIAPFYNFTEYSSTRAPYFPDFLKKFSFETNKVLPKVKCPIYIFHGDADGLIPLQNSIRLKKLFKPNDALIILENQGHIGVNNNLIFNKKVETLLQ